MCACVFVCTCLQRGVGGRKSQRCQLFNRVPLKVSKVGASGGGCGGVPEVRARPVALATTCKIASSELVGTVGFVSFRGRLSRSAWRGTSGTAETAGPIRTRNNGPLPLCSATLSSLFFSLLRFLLWSFFSCCPCAPPPTHQKEVSG